MLKTPLLEARASRGYVLTLGGYRKRGFLRAGYRSRRRPRRAGGFAEVRRKGTEVPPVNEPAVADRLMMLTSFVGGAEALPEKTEVPNTSRAVLVIVRVADISTVVCIGVVLR